MATITTTRSQPQTRRAPAGRRAPALRMPDWGAAGWAALAAGTLFMVLELGLLPWSKGGNAWVPVRMVAAIVYGSHILPPAPYFPFGGQPDTGMFYVAVAMHYSLSLIYLRLLSFAIFKLDRWTSLAAGAVFGLVLYGLNFYVFTHAFPWFVAARGWVSVFANLAFGVVGAALYKFLEREEPLMEAGTLEERL